MTLRGHKVKFIAGAKHDSSVIETAGFSCHKVERDWLGHYSSLSQVVKTLNLEQPVAAVHTFEHEGLLYLIRACKDLGISLCWTICGGPPASPYAYDYLRFKGVVSLSEEVKIGLVRNAAMDANDITVIPARIDTNAVLEQVNATSEDKLETFKQKYRIDAEHFIMRVARIHPAYERSMLEGIETAVRLNDSGHSVCFLHFGFVQDEASFERIKDATKCANKRCGHTVAVTVQDEALEALSYLKLANIVMGTGRSAFEGMLALKPTIVVGPNGFAGMVDETSVGAIAHYNFAGRNIEQFKSFETSLLETVQVCQNILNHKDLAQSLGAFGHAYVMDTLDVSRAVDKYLEHYHRYDVTTLPTDLELAFSTVVRNIKSFSRRLLPSSLGEKIRDFATSRGYKNG